MELLTKKDLAKILKCSETHVARMIRRIGLPHIRISPSGSNNERFILEEVLTFLKQLPSEKKKP